jgi:hypothetical protein
VHLTHIISKLKKTWLAVIADYIYVCQRFRKNVILHTYIYFIFAKSHNHGSFPNWTNFQIRKEHHKFSKIVKFGYKISRICNIQSCSLCLRPHLTNPNTNHVCALGHRLTVMHIHVYYNLYYFTNNYTITSQTSRLYFT